MRTGHGADDGNGGGDDTAHDTAHDTDHDTDRRVKEIFERVLDAPPGERDAILDRDCGTARVRSEVIELLRLADDPGDFLEVPAGHRILGAPEDEARLAPGDEVADFTVVGLLGAGGGGVVYDADQREPKRRVALKMIRVRSRTDDALRAFRDEAANLARLHHAAIAHVYAAGVRETAGRAEPWIAMERIDGARSIVRHARDTGLSRDERLRLFLEVCAALHHAHENGVIHRDVTPGNVLVDSEGRPKVVDFGVACGTAEAGEQGTGAVGTGAVGTGAVGTLAYASPEQLSAERTADRGPVDRRADVYGLGAVLFELLTGRVPLDVEDLPVPEAVRIKRTAAVRAPSAFAADVPPDLDAIVLRALAADPVARYDSAASLGADLARFLASEPVAAYAGGAAYQLGKFVRRRRAAAAAITGVAAALVVGAGVSVWFAIGNAAARDLADRRSYVAEISAAAAAVRVDDVAEARRRLDRAPAGLRDWEWRHLASRIDVSSETATFPGREILYGSVSRDGEVLAISGVDRGSPGGLDRFVAALRRDGTRLVEWTQRAGPGAGAVRVVRADGSVLVEGPSTDVSGVPAAAISPDGRGLVVGLTTGGVLAFDLATARESHLPAAHADRVIAVTFSPDGSQFATAGKDGTARLWSWADRSLVHTFQGHPDRVICLAFDAAGSRLVTGCRDGVVRVFDTATGHAVRALAGHEASVEGVSVSPDGARVASVSRDRTVRLWNLADGSVVAVGRSHTSNVRDVAFDPLGETFVSASWDGTLRAWDARTGAERGVLRGHGSAVTAVAFAGREPRLVSFSRDGTVRRWDPERTDVATFRGLLDYPASVAFAPDGAHVAVAGRDGVLSLLDARTARVVATGVSGGVPLGSAAFLDARALVVLTDGHEIQTWTVPQDGGELVRARRLSHPGTYHGAVCAATGAPLRESGGDDGSADASAATVWVTEAGSDVVYDAVTCIDLRSDAVLERRTPPIPADVIACDGRGGVVVGSRDGRVAFSRKGADWREVAIGRGAVLSVAFDETGDRIVASAAGGEARVLRTSDLSTLLVLRGHSDDVYQAAFLPGGRRIVTVSRDVTVRLWDTRDGENVLVLHEHGYPVTCVAVSPDGTRIATGAGAAEDRQSTVRIWAAPPVTVPAPR